MVTNRTLTLERAPKPSLPRLTVAEESAALRERIRWPVRAAFSLVLGLVGGFAVWGSLSPLASGAVASGIISPDGSTKTVQHLEGGIIGSLLVREGDVVGVGQPLVVLEDVQPKAMRDMVVTQHRTNLITRQRLEAEQAEADDVTMPPELLTVANDPEVRTLFQSQRGLFRARKASHLSRKRVLRQRIEQLSEQAKGHEAQVDSATRQLALIAEELEGKEVLRLKQIVAKPEILRLQRMQAEIDGERGEHLAAIARTRQQIGETELELLMVDAERIDSIATELVALRSELAAVQERLAASEDVLKRTVVVAPVSGTVHHLRYKTEGGVVRAGEPILDLVPLQDTLVIDARISPTDIDVVHPGLTAQVHLSAFSSRSLLRINGVVQSVSADRLVDDGTQQPYFLARVEVNRDELSQIDPKLELVPGMPAEVLIVTGDRTMVEYLFQPFINMFWKSFRET